MERRRPMAAGHGIPRPSSAPRRGLDYAWVTKGPQDRMSKQSSVPNLADRSLSDLRKRAPERQALRRSASAASLGRDRPRRPERGPVPGQAWGSFQKADALQLESRLTQRLREHISSIEPTRRPRKSQVPSVERPGRSPYRSTWEAPQGYPSPGFYSFGTPGKRTVHSAASSPYQPSYQPSYSQLGGDESQLKIYSDLFEEVIERDRVFGPLLRKVKGAYDSMLSQAPSREERTPGQSLRASRSSEPTIREEPWELYRENQALKDLIERLHMELEEAVKREQRWKTKAAKLKARVGTPQEVYPQLQVPGPGFPEWARPEDLDARRPAFQANRREPGYEVGDILNQGGLISLSSISPQHSQLHHLEGSARSDDSGILPQKPERRVLRPASVPKLDLTKMQELLEEEYDEEEQYEEGAEEHYDDGHDVSDDGGRAPSEA